MEVVRHHHELVHLELAGQGVHPKHVNEKLGFVRRLKKPSSHVVLHPAKNVRAPATISRRSDFRVSFTIRSG